MKAELRRLHSPDIYDLENYLPDNPKVFGFLLQAFVGPKGGVGEESFDIQVCTPRWLEENSGEDEVIVGRHYLIVRKYDHQKLRAAIDGFLRDCSGESWGEVAVKVSRLGKWEFEDYKE